MIKIPDPLTAVLYVGGALFTGTVAILVYGFRGALRLGINMLVADWIEREQRMKSTIYEAQTVAQARYGSGVQAESPPPEMQPVISQVSPLSPPPMNIYKRQSHEVSADCATCMVATDLKMEFSELKEQFGILQLDFSNFLPMVNKSIEHAISDCDALRNSEYYDPLEKLIYERFYNNG